MKRVMLVAMLVGCGDDGGGGTADAFIPQGPDYDLSCLGEFPTTVPNPLTSLGTLVDMTAVANPQPVPNTEIRVYQLSDNTLLGMGTTDMDGKYMFEVTTTGTPVLAYSEYQGTGLVKTRAFVNIPLNMVTADGLYATVQQSRLDSLATALGGTLDPAKGVLEVWANDCSKFELPQATVTLDAATDTQWAMFGGVGAWLPRATTLGHPNNANTGSIAGTINVTPGMHTVTVAAGGQTLGPFTIMVEANSLTLMHIYPGI